MAEEREGEGEERLPQPDLSESQREDELQKRLGNVPQLLAEVLNYAQTVVDLPGTWPGGSVGGDFFARLADAGRSPPAPSPAETAPAWELPQFQPPALPDFDAGQFQPPSLPDMPDLLPAMPPPEAQGVPPTEHAPSPPPEFVVPPPEYTPPPLEDFSLPGAAFTPEPPAELTVSTPQPSPAAEVAEWPQVEWPALPDFNAGQMPVPPAPEGDYAPAAVTAPDALALELPPLESPALPDFEAGQLPVPPAPEGEFAPAAAAAADDADTMFDFGRDVGGLPRVDVPSPFGEGGTSRQPQQDGEQSPWPNQGAGTPAGNRPGPEAFKWGNIHIPDLNAEEAWTGGASPSVAASTLAGMRGAGGAQDGLSQDYGSRFTKEQNILSRGDYGGPSRAQVIDFGQR